MQRARVWRLYLAGVRLGFELNQIQLHQILGVKTAPGRPVGDAIASRLGTRTPTAMTCGRR